MSAWKRFDDKSENYDLYRPRYPEELLELLKRETGLGASSVVADIGSGTGLLAELLLKSKCKLFCVEPNREMRRIAINKLGKDDRCKILTGTAESTSLPAESVNIITAGQAFHWFDPRKSKKEFARILRSNGHVVLVWNTRPKSNNGMNFEYERLVREYSKDYHASGIGATNQEVIKKFYDGDFRSFELKNDQKLSLEGLLGRYLSASYAITEKDPRFGQMKNDFREVFDNNATNGLVTIEYETEVFIGSLGKQIS